MWEFFELELRKRLSEINVEEGMSERVRSALLEMLPSGQTTVEDLALPALEARSARRVVPDRRRRGRIAAVA
jgi:hypothetical protein